MAFPEVKRSFPVTFTGTFASSPAVFNIIDATYAIIDPSITGTGSSADYDVIKGKSINGNFAPTVSASSFTLDDIVGIIGGFTLTSASSTTFSVPKLKYITSGINITSCASLTSVSFPELEYLTGGLAVGNTNTNVTTISFPKLKSVSSGSFTLAGALSNKYTSLSFPLLERIQGAFSITPSSNVLTTCDFSSLKYTGSTTSMVMNSATASVSFPAMISWGGVVSITNCTGMTSSVLGVSGTLKSIGGNITLTGGTGLGSSGINTILALLVSLDGTNGTTTYGSGRTIQITGTGSTESGQGVTDKATLVSRGATVTIN